MHHGTDCRNLSELPARSDEVERPGNIFPQGYECRTVEREVQLSVRSLLESRPRRAILSRKHEGLLGKSRIYAYQSDQGCAHVSRVDGQVEDVAGGKVELARRNGSRNLIDAALLEGHLEQLWSYKNCVLSLKSAFVGDFEAGDIVDGRTEFDPNQAAQVAVYHRQPGEYEAAAAASLDPYRILTVDRRDAVSEIAGRLA